MTRRLLLMLLCGLASLLWSKPRAVRALECVSAIPGHVVNVRVRVSFNSVDGSLPKAFIIEESWPQGFRLVKARWNGHTIATDGDGGRLRWLWGYGEGSPAVSDGELTYAMQVPSENWHSTAGVSGEIFTSDETELIFGSSQIDWTSPDGIPFPRLYCAIEPGWNLLSMPSSPDQSENFRILKAFFDDFWVLPDSGGGTWMRTPAEALSSGLPFWCHWEFPEARQLLFYGVESSESGATLDGIHVANDRKWRFNNQRLADEYGGIWQWDKAAWRRMADGHAGSTRGGWLHEQQ